jgi:hypothetical protein
MHNILQHISPAIPVFLICPGSNDLRANGLSSLAETELAVGFYRISQHSTGSLIKTDFIRAARIVADWARLRHHHHHLPSISRLNGAMIAYDFPF